MNPAFGFYNNDGYYMINASSAINSVAFVNQNGRRSGRSRNHRHNYNRNYFPNRQRQAENGNLMQRERLIEQINQSAIECLICYDTVRTIDRIWSCFKCFNILHLNCVKKWAERSVDEYDEWHCPACQLKQTQKNFFYYCYCGLVRNPDYCRDRLPHSCGHVCDRKRDTCNHLCQLLCHPGPCPDCSQEITKFCACGAVSRWVICSDKSDFICDNVCNKDLNCGLHKCEQQCHHGDCNECPKVLTSKCPCGRTEKQVNCGEQNRIFMCDKKCDRLLECGNHRCEELCHTDLCMPCIWLPSLDTKCPCGKTDVNCDRKTCLDPILCCDNICDKKLTCGPTDKNHKCPNRCHLGECSTCNLKTTQKCRCGATRKVIACSQLNRDGSYVFSCEKKCQKRRNCGKHKCNNVCCTLDHHVCPIICNRILFCGQHRCEELCHLGRCKPCYNSSFDELSCECGYTIMYPPVPCGTRQPKCDQLCRRNHDCEHDVTHNCHSEVKCPPCRTLTTKFCYGKHELRATIPCYQDSFSCGKPCDKPLPCGRHTCRKACHKDVCYTATDTCKQPCKQPRICGHPCNLKCHDLPCPNTQCKDTVTVSCPCRLIKVQQPCANFRKEYEKVAAERSLLSNQSDPDEQKNARVNFAILECDDECRKYARNLRFALALHIENPDLSGKIVPRYPDSMKQWVKKDPEFCQMVHDKLTELVKLSKESKQKFRSYSFSSMNKHKRQFIHQYCEFFRCDSAAYDAEPNRNVVATSTKDKSWLPSMSVIEVIKRENGMRRVPLPLALPAISTTGNDPTEMVSLKKD